MKASKAQFQQKFHCIFNYHIQTGYESSSLSIDVSHKEFSRSAAVKV
jgi:hypothetical protein